MTTSRPDTDARLSGSFRYTFATNTLVWSDHVFAIHGFAPGDVVPSLDLALSHIHPDDREEAARLVDEVRATGRPFAFWHRILDSEGDARRVLSIGAGVVDAGALVGFSGYVADVTDQVRRAVADEVEDALVQLSRSRPAIEQSKGALMLTYGLDADTAFHLLRRYSQVANVKVRVLAHDFATAIRTGSFPLGTRETWDRLAAEVSTPEEPTGQAAE